MANFLSNVTCTGTVGATLVLGTTGVYDGATATAGNRVYSPNNPPPGGTGGTTTVQPEIHPFLLFGG